MGLASTSELAWQHCERLWQAYFAPRPFVEAEIRDFLHEFENKRVDYDRHELYDALRAVRDANAAASGLVGEPSAAGEGGDGGDGGGDGGNDDGAAALAAALQQTTQRVADTNAMLKECMRADQDAGAATDSARRK